MNDTVILLTATVTINKNKIFMFQQDKEERLQTYLKSIQQWLNTSLPIVVVENSNYDLQLKHPRLDYITYDETKYDVYESSSKGISELFAIRYAYDHSERLQKAGYIIKITARYFIPELESYLKTIDLSKYECFVQHDIDRCEMVGARHDFFNTVFKYNTDYHHIEDYYKATAASLKKKISKKFIIEPTQRGSFDEIVDTI